MDYNDKKDIELNSYDPEKSAQFYENLPKEVVELLLKTHPLKGKNRTAEEYDSEEEAFLHQPEPEEYEYDQEEPDIQPEAYAEEYPERKIFARKITPRVPREEPPAPPQTSKWGDLEEDQYLYDDDWDDAYEEGYEDDGERRKVQFAMPVLPFRFIMILTMCVLVVIIGALVYKNNSLLSQIEELTSQKESNTSDTLDTTGVASYEAQIQSLESRIQQQEELIQALQGNTVNGSNTTPNNNSSDDSLAFKPIEPTVPAETTQPTAPANESTQGASTSANTSNNNSSSSNTYTVQSGDTLWKIAGGDKNKVDSIMEINGIEPGDHIYAGQILTLP